MDDNHKRRLFQQLDRWTLSLQQEWKHRGKSTGARARIRLAVKAIRQLRNALGAK